MTTYEKPEANEWVQPIPDGYLLACCDCGLVHEVDFRIHQGRIQFRVRRNNRRTAAKRRHMGWRIKKDGSGYAQVETP